MDRMGYGMKWKISLLDPGSRHNLHSAKKTPNPQAWQPVLVPAWQKKNSLLFSGLAYAPSLFPEQYPRGGPRKYTEIVYIKANELVH